MTGLPLVIHAREADADLAAILSEETEKGAFPAVLHCFSSGRALAETGIALGHYVSFSGILTFKNAEELRDIARDLPADRILVETDAPYLAPPPHRGKRNEPAYVAHMAAVLAQTRGVGREEIAAARRRRISSACSPKSAGLRAAWPIVYRFTILGCGSSPGVPRIGGDWGACDPANPKNRRRRCSLLAQRCRPSGATNVLIDTSPDLREQALAAGHRHARRRALHASACRPHPRHRRPARLRHEHAPARRSLRRRGDDGAALGGVRLLLRDAAGQRIPAAR